MSTHKHETRSSCNTATKNTSDQSDSVPDIATIEMTMQKKAVVKLYRLPETTVSRILKNNVNQSVATVNSRLQSLRDFRAIMLAKMEQMLMEWVIKIAEKNNGRVKKDKVMRKAVQIFEKLKKQFGYRAKTVHFEPDKDWFSEFRVRAGWSKPHISNQTKAPSSRCDCGFEDFDEDLHENQSNLVSKMMSECNDSSESWLQRTKASLIHKKAKELQLCTVLPINTFCNSVNNNRTDIQMRGASIEMAGPESDVSKPACAPENIDFETECSIVTSKQVATQLLKQVNRETTVEHTQGVSDQQPLSTDTNENESSTVEKGTSTVQNDITDIVMSRVTSEENLTPDEKGTSTVQNDKTDVVSITESSEENSTPQIVSIESCAPTVDISNDNPCEVMLEIYSPQRLLSTSVSVSETKENLRACSPLSTSMNIETDPLKNFHRLFEKVIRAEKYIPQQVFNVCEMALFWKKLPQSCDIKEDVVEGQLPQSKDPTMLLLGSNASGDCKLEPLLVYSKENPNAISRIIKSSLPVIWKFHPRVKVTSSLFEDWFTYSFIPTVQVYCLEHAIPFKILLILDNSPCHSRILEFAHPNIKVLFLPSSNGSCDQQPMDRGICAAFKANYLNRMFETIAEVVDQENGETLNTFWKSFNILSSLKLMKLAWCDITTSIITSAWKVMYSKPLLKHEISDPFMDVLCRIKQNALKLELVVSEEDIKDWMNYHCYELTNDELRLLEAESSLEDSNKQLASLTPSKLLEAFKCLESAMKIFESEDPNLKRSSIVVENIKRSYQCYRKIYMDQKNNSRQVNELDAGGCDDNMDVDDDDDDNFNSEINLPSPVDVKPIIEEAVLQDVNVDDIKKEDEHL